jgi:peptidyl-prolyl cis-trans isomerase SurA
MKFISKNTLFSLCLFLITTAIVFGQEVIQDTVKTKNTVVDLKRHKIDGVIATVGDFNILDSDIDKSFLELSSQGNSVKDITRCQMLGKLLEDKLYAHQAIQDSIIVTDDEVKSKMEEQLAYMVEQLGSMDKVVAYFKKSSEEDFRTDLSEIIKMNKLSSSMQKKIIDDVEITPEEVRSFFKRIPVAELPLFGAEMEVSQIVVAPKVSAEERQKVIDRLKEFKKDVLEGASFSTKAVLYSQDPGSSSNGGFYKMNKKTPFVKELREKGYKSDYLSDCRKKFNLQFVLNAEQLETLKNEVFIISNDVLSSKDYWLQIHGSIDNPEDFEVRWTGKLEMSPIISVEQEQSKSGCDVNFKFVCEDSSVFYAKLRWGYGQCITNIRLDIK